MSDTQLLLQRNRAFADTGAFKDLGMRPNTSLVIVGCLDPRVDPAVVFGLGLGDAPVLRNAGGRVTDAIIDDIAFMGMAAEAAPGDGPLFEVAVIHHTQCGTAMLADDARRAAYAERIGAEESELRDRAVTNPERTVTDDVAKLRAAKSIPARVRLSGHVYDVETGLLRTIVPTASVR